MFILFSLLVISLLVTLAGLFLSSSSREDLSQQQEKSYTTNRWGAERPIRGRSYVVRRDMLRGNATTMPVRARGYVPEQGRRTRGTVFSLANAADFLSLRSEQQAQWLGILLLLLVLFGVLYSVHTRMLGSNLVWGYSQAGISAPASAPPTTNTSSSTAALGTSGASKALVRINQLDPSQYANQQDYNTWAYSTCSAAAMTEVINAYGHHYRIADILKVEAGLGEITPDLGLLEPKGIDRTVAKFGFKTMWFNKPSLDQVIAFANQGHPVIVSFPPDRWPGGHLLVVRGGDNNNVFLADSSRLNMQTMSRSTFMGYWEGFAVAVFPQ